MGRILAATQPALGHFIPLSRLLGHMAERGASITVVSSPSFASVVTTRGWAFEGVGPAWLAEDVAPTPFAFGESPELRPGAYEFPRHVLTSAFDQAMDVVRSDPPQLLLREPTEFCVTAAAELCGVPIVTLGIGFFRSIERLMLDGGEHVIEFRRRVGLPCDSAAIARAYCMRYIHVLPPEVECVPDTVVAPLLRPAEVGYSDPPDKTRLLVTLGTLLRNPEIWRGLLEELAEVRHSCVIADNGAMPRNQVLPHNVELLSFAPLGDVIPAVTAVVCHGGFGTLAAALGHGRPVIVTPTNADQFWNGRKIEEIGAGCVVGLERLGSGSLSAAIDHLLMEKSHASAAASMRESFANMPGLHIATKFVESSAHVSRRHEG